MARSRGSTRRWNASWARECSTRPLRLLDQFGSPAQIRKAGRPRLTLIRPKAPRMAERLVEDLFTALDEQTVVVPGTDAAALIVPTLANSLQAVLDQRKLLAGRIEELLEGHPLSKVAYHDKKISQGKHHTQALLRLARRRADVLFAMLRDDTFHEPQPAPSP